MSDLPVSNPVAKPGFPRDDSLCERCGYSLRDLPYENDCPECGQKIADSDPARNRPGLPWQNSRSPASWWRTVVLVTCRPGDAYARLRVDSKQRSERGGHISFLFIAATFVGLYWFIMDRITALDDQSNALRRYGMLVVVAWVVILLTHIEALGVAWFSWRRGWRVPFRLAERVSCYASIGWVPAGILCNVLWLWYDRRILQGKWYPFFEDERDLLILLTVGMITILWFEWLVWLGVRRVKYANAT